MTKVNFHNRLQKALVAFSTIAVCLPIVPVSALELNAATTLTARHSNNTFLTEDDTTNNFSLEPGILLDASHDASNLRADLTYQFERRFHSESDNTERNFFRGGANISWTALPDRLEFNVNQTSTESTLNATQFGSPNDTIVTDNLSAGPTLLFRLRGTDQLRFTYLYENRNDAIDENDSDSDVLAASYEYRVSEFSAFTIEHRQEDIEFNANIVPDLDVTRQTLSYNYRNAGNSLLLVGGFSEYERDGAETVDGAVGELRWDKDFAATTIGIFGEHEITNQSSRLFTDIDDFDIDQFNLFLNANIAEVFTETNYGFDVSHDIGATRASFSAGIYITDYEGEIAADFKEYVISIGAVRRVNRNMTLDLRASVRNYDEDDQPGTPLRPATIGRENKFYEGSATVDWNIASNFNLAVGLQYRNLTSGIDEVVSYATARYSLFQRR